MCLQGAGSLCGSGGNGGRKGKEKALTALDACQGFCIYQLNSGLFQVSFYFATSLQHSRLCRRVGCNWVQQTVVVDRTFNSEE
jgi:hypothetical protein